MDLTPPAELHVPEKCLARYKQDYYFIYIFHEFNCSTMFFPINHPTWMSKPCFKFSTRPFHSRQFKCHSKKKAQVLLITLITPVLYLLWQVKSTGKRVYYSSNLLTVTNKVWFKKKKKKGSKLKVSWLAFFRPFTASHGLHLAWQARATWLRLDF